MSKYFHCIIIIIIIIIIVIIGSLTLGRRTRKVKTNIEQLWADTWG